MEFLRSAFNNWFLTDILLNNRKMLVCSDPDCTQGPKIRTELDHTFLIHLHAARGEAINALCSLRMFVGGFRALLIGEIIYYWHARACVYMFDEALSLRELIIIIFIFGSYRQAVCCLNETISFLEF